MKIEELNKYQPNVLKIIKNSYNHNKLVHCYLFDGPSGVGTEETAMYFAMMLLCENKEKPCFNCSACKRILAKSHLNVIFIEPDTEIIKKDQIDDLIKEFSMTSLEKGAKIAIVKDVDKISTSAANSLLKFLEEPANNHFTIMTTTNINKVLDTIISRSGVIHFTQIPSSLIISQLVELGVNSDLAFVLAHLTTDLTYAKQMIEEGNIMNLLTFAKEVVKINLSGKDPFIKYFQNKDLILMQSSKQIHRFILDIFAFIYQEVFKAIINNKCDYFEDIINEIPKESIDLNQIINKLEKLNSYQERLAYGVNLDLFYTSLMTEL